MRVNSTWRRLTGVLAAIAAATLSGATMLDAGERLSDPTINLQMELFSGLSREQIPAPSCESVDDLAPLFSLKWVRSYQPCTDEQHREWLSDMQQYRRERRIRVGYDGSRYDKAELQWTQQSYIQPQMMAEDRYFFDPDTQKYTVDRYLDDLTDRYGGIDSVLIWPTYPNLGIDDRNQLDLVRSMPGGVAGLRQVISDFHRRGVRVLFPMMMWDQGTRDPGRPWPEAIAELMSEIGADGINGDTQDGVPRVFTDASDRSGHSLVFEPEGPPADEQLGYNLMSWGYYKYPWAPLVSRYKWLEPRHMVHVSDRWNKDKTDNLQVAFFNGIGWESWENIWGYWNGITERDGEATRRVAMIERAVSQFLHSADWEPYAPMLRYGTYASRWPAGSDSVWTIVNRNDYDLDGPEMKAEPGMRYYDLYHGVELVPTAEKDALILSFAIERHGFGAVLATKGPPPPSIDELMRNMRTRSARRLSDFSAAWRPLAQRLVVDPNPKPPARAPDGMIRVPEAEFLFTVQGIEAEGANAVGVDVQYSWEETPRIFHKQLMHINAFWIDRYPVTNVQFKRFLDATHYSPSDAHDFLRDWQNGMYPSGWADKPVTWVSREDAEAYAGWAGKRLPHEWEWQYAAQGLDGRLYPWGNEWDSSAVPAPDHGRTMRGPDEVGAHPRGASPFGVQDLVGNVWQWTDEYADDHTRSATVRGGSYYQPQNSLWYFPQAYKLHQHGRLLLMSPRMDRSGAVGFRCAADAPAGRT